MSVKFSKFYENQNYLETNLCIHKPIGLVVLTFIGYKKKTYKQSIYRWYSIDYEISTAVDFYFFKSHGVINVVWKSYLIRGLKGIIVNRHWHLTWKVTWNIAFSPFQKSLSSTRRISREGEMAVDHELRHT